MPAGPSAKLCVSCRIGIGLRARRFAVTLRFDPTSCHDSPAPKSEERTTQTGHQPRLRSRRRKLIVCDYCEFRCAGERRSSDTRGDVSNFTPQVFRRPHPPRRRFRNSGDTNCSAACVSGDRMLRTLRLVRPSGGNAKSFDFPVNRTLALEPRMSGSISSPAEDSISSLAEETCKRTRHVKWPYLDASLLLRRWPAARHETRSFLLVVIFRS